MLWNNGQFIPEMTRHDEDLPMRSDLRGGR